MGYMISLLIFAVFFLVLITVYIGRKLGPDKHTSVKNVIKNDLLQGGSVSRPNASIGAPLAAIAHETTEGSATTTILVDGENRSKDGRGANDQNVIENVGRQHRPANSVVTPTFVNNRSESPAARHMDNGNRPFSSMPLVTINPSPAHMRANPSHLHDVNANVQQARGKTNYQPRLRVTAQVHTTPKDMPNAQAPTSGVASQAAGQTDSQLVRGPAQVTIKPSDAKPLSPSASDLSQKDKHPRSGQPAAAAVTLPKPIPTNNNKSPSKIGHLKLEDVDKHVNSKSNGQNNDDQIRLIRPEIKPPVKTLEPSQEQRVQPEKNKNENPPVPTSVGDSRRIDHAVIKQDQKQDKGGPEKDKLATQNQQNTKDVPSLVPHANIEKSFLRANALQDIDRSIDVTSFSVVMTPEITNAIKESIGSANIANRYCVLRISGSMLPTGPSKERKVKKALIIGENEKGKPKRFARMRILLNSGENTASTMVFHDFTPVVMDRINYDFSNDMVTDSKGSEWREFPVQAVYLGTEKLERITTVDLLLKVRKSAEKNTKKEENTKKKKKK